jgi:hypothetical protein
MWIWRAATVEVRATRRDERPWRAVPVPAWLALGAALAAQLALDRAAPRPAATAAALAPPPTVAAMRVATLGDALPLAKALNLYLQAHDNQPGLSLPFAQLDYARVLAWLSRILEVDSRGPYPLFAASRLYGEAPDPERQRVMLDFVHAQFLSAPDERWTALAHAAYVARHRLNDLPRARAYAHSLRVRTSPARVPSWARQMELLLLADLDEAAAARVLLGGMLESGGIRDAAELRFLTHRLEAAEARRQIPQAPGYPRP